MNKHARSLVPITYLGDTKNRAKDSISRELILIGFDFNSLAKYRDAAKEIVAKMKNGQHVELYPVGGHHSRRAALDIRGWQALKLSFPDTDCNKRILVDLENIDNYIRKITPSWRRQSAKLRIIQNFMAAKKAGTEFAFFGSSARFWSELRAYFFWAEFGRMQVFQEQQPALSIEKIKEVWQILNGGEMVLSPAFLRQVIKPSDTPWMRQNIDEICDMSEIFDMQKFDGINLYDAKTHPRIDLINKTGLRKQKSKQRNYMSDIFTAIELFFTSDHAPYLERPLQKWLCEPIAFGGNERIILLMGLICRLPLENRDQPILTDTTIRKTLCHEFPALNDFIFPNKLKPKAIITSRHNFGTGLHMNHKMFQAWSKRVEFGANIHLHLEPIDEWPSELSQNYRPCIHFGFPLFEYPQLPKQTLQACKAVDAILAPSGFIKNALEAQGCENVFAVGKALNFPKIKQGDYAYEWKDAPYFLVSFDAHSGVERKNPVAALQAFLELPAGHDYHLVIKTTPLYEPHWGDPYDQMQILRDAAFQCHNIHLIERYWSFDRYLSLVANAQALISPHRAEGFGYLPAMALWYKTPVIATDYSGTHDFISLGTAFPVKYNIERLPRTLHPQGVHEAEWANIDICDLSENIKTIIEQPKLAKMRAKQGQKLIQSYYSQNAFDLRMQQIIQIYLGGVSDIKEQSFVLNNLPRSANI